jgi:hypothetical protein
MQRDAPGARPAPNPSACLSAVSRGRPRAGKCVPSRGPDRPAGGRDDRGGRPGCGDGVGGRRGPRPDGQRHGRSPSKRVTAITRGADREETVAATTDLLANRRVHEIEAAARFDSTRHRNRSTSGTTGSVRRSIEAVTEGLEGSAPGPHLALCMRRVLRIRCTCEETVDADAAADAQSAPTAPACLQKNQNEDKDDDGRPDLRGFR